MQSSQSSGAHFKKNFSPRDYLNEYYTHIGDENKNLLVFFAKCYEQIPANSTILEFGGGPTVYQLISATTKALQIHFSDFLDVNLKEVKSWRQAAFHAFNWIPFIKATLKIENQPNDKKSVTERETLLRKKITKFLHCDAFKKNPLGEKYRHVYDVVSVNFVPDSITSSKSQWKTLITNIVSLLNSQGTLIMTALKNATHWRVGDAIFPAVNIMEEDVKSVLKDLGFRDVTITTIAAEVTDETAENYEGYKGMIFVLARK